MTLRARAARGATRAGITAGLVAFAASPRVRQRPYPGFRVMRSLDPVHHSPIGFWVLTGHAEVSAVLRDARLGVEEHKADLSILRVNGLNRLLGRAEEGGRHDGPFIDLFHRLMLFRDPPDHTRLRRLVSKAFTPPRAEALAPRVEELVDELLEPAVRRGSIELLQELAYPLPARVICDLLGVPRGDDELVVRLAPALATGLDPSPMRTAEAVAAADRAVVELTEYLDGLIESKRRAPGDDLLSALLAAEDDGDTLTHEELVGTVVLLLIAGHETTANLIGNGVLALLRHPAQLARLRNDPGLDRTAVEELLRYDSPVQMTQRIALAPVELGDVTVPAGHMVIACLGAANRDPAVFERPDELDVGRSPNPHVALSGGAHFCLGAPLARMEARIAVPAIVRRLPGLRLAGPPPRRRPSFTIRALQRLDLTWP